jgi:hypothetical protein
MSELLLDRAVDVDRQRRCRDSTPAAHQAIRACATRPTHPKVEEIVAVMRTAGDRPHGRRLRGLIVIMWRAGLRIQEALALTEGDLDQRRGSLLVRRARADAAGRSAWTHGDGHSSSPGLTCVAGSRSAPFSASSAAPHAAATGHRLRHVRTCGAWQP